MMDIIKKPGEITRESDKLNVRVNWYYDEQDEDIYEARVEFQELMGIGFNFVATD